MIMRSSSSDLASPSFPSSASELLFICSFLPCRGVAITPYLHFEVTGQGPFSKKCLQGSTRPLPLRWKWAEHGSVGEPTAETRLSRRDSNRLLGRPRRERVIEWWAGHREHVLVQCLVIDRTLAGGRHGRVRLSR